MSATPDPTADIPASHPPRILAPAGSRDAFLAALAAGADAVYCGLKQFSARMAARNFDGMELARLIDLARGRNVEVYVAVNSLVRTEELPDLGRRIGELVAAARPDALIVQDPGVIPVARQAGFSGDFHLSTLANLSFPDALSVLTRPPFAGEVTRVVLPRELSVDEIRKVAARCPDSIELEAFIHGALCYGVSGRCYWSSYLGGKSGLRGRCVQPCRRPYEQEGRAPRSAFSCRDLGLDVLIKVLRTVPRLGTWKIEGRKKGAHYVYYAVTAYRMLRDEGADPAVKRAALALLDRALGRPASHFRFLGHRIQNPAEASGETGSGLLVGRVKGGKVNPFLSPREPLMKGDLIRFGYEDEAGHVLRRVPVSIPRKGRYFLAAKGEGRPPAPGLPAFLIDRREPALARRIAEMASEMSPGAADESAISAPTGDGLRWPRPVRARTDIDDVAIRRTAPRSKGEGCWLAARTLEATPSHRIAETWWWLPPVIWPDDESRWRDTVGAAIRKGARRFVPNMLWQTALFPDIRSMECWAGPFCNLGNPFALGMAAEMGYRGAFVSPELGKADLLALPEKSPLPLGIVLSGNWPLCVSRIAPEGIEPGTAFSSPRGEGAWVARHGKDFWIFPNWSVDLSEHRPALERAGYRLFARIEEPVPKGVSMKNRPGLWNWDQGLS
jgi:U32 family peptidase